MIFRFGPALLLAIALLAPPFATKAPAEESRASSASKRSATPPPRRVIIFGTTIVGDVLAPSVERTVPWQRPEAFQADTERYVPHFTDELLTPLNRDAILPDPNDPQH